MVKHADSMKLANRPVAEVLMKWNVEAVYRKLDPTHGPVPERLEQMKELLEKMEDGTVPAPTVAVLGSLGGVVRFLDGRHRFHAIREAGAKTIVMGTSMQMMEAAIKFGLVVPVEGSEE